VWHSSCNRNNPLSRDKRLCRHSSGNSKSLLVGATLASLTDMVLSGPRWVVRLENFVTGRANRLGDQDLR
jgi:hypothetical protein